MRDIHSFSRPDEASVKHLALDLAVDFDKQQLSGTARLDLDNRGARELLLDTNGLTIAKVTADGKPAQFSLGDAVKYLGRALTIAIEPGTKSVSIDYTTSPDAAAVQWLAPEQTAGGNHPFL